MMSLGGLPSAVTDDLGGRAFSMPDDRMMMSFHAHNANHHGVQGGAGMEDTITLGLPAEPSDLHLAHHQTSLSSSERQQHLLGLARVESGASSKMMVDVVHNQHQQQNQLHHLPQQDSSMSPSISLPKRSLSLGTSCGGGGATGASVVDAEAGELELPMLPNAISTPQLHAQLHPRFFSPSMMLQDNYHLPHSVFSPTPKLIMMQPQQQLQQSQPQLLQPHVWSMADAAADNASQQQPQQFFPPSAQAPQPSSSGPSIAAMFEQQHLLQQQQRQQPQWQPQQLEQPQPQQQSSQLHRPQPRSSSSLTSPAPRVSQQPRRPTLRRSGVGRNSALQRLRALGNNIVKQEQQQPPLASLVSPLSMPPPLFLIQQQQQAAELQLQHEITLQAQHLRQVQQQRLELEMLRVTQLRELHSLQHVQQGLHTQMVLVAHPPPPSSVPASIPTSSTPSPAGGLTPLSLPMPNQVDEYIQGLSADQFDLLVQRRRHLQQQQQQQEQQTYRSPSVCPSTVPPPLLPPPGVGSLCSGPDVSVPPLSPAAAVRLDAFVAKKGSTAVPT
jgi:hypothetical protein